MRCVVVAPILALAGFGFVAGLTAADSNASAQENCDCNYVIVQEIDSCVGGVVLDPTCDPSEFGGETIRLEVFLCPTFVQALPESILAEVLEDVTPYSAQLATFQLMRQGESNRYFGSQFLPGIGVCDPSTIKVSVRSTLAEGFWFTQSASLTVVCTGIFCIF